MSVVSQNHDLIGQQANAEIKRLHFSQLKARPRRQMPDDGKLRALGQSVRKRQLVPLLIASASLPPPWEILDGNCRFIGGRLEGVEFFDCIVVEGDIGNAAEIALVTALQRHDLPDFDQFQNSVEWIAAHVGATAKNLAAAINRDPALVCQTMSLEKCIEPVKRAAAEGRIGRKEWYPISQVSAAAQAELLAAALNGITRSELQSQVRKHKSKGKPAVKMNLVKCVLPGALVTLKKAEATLDDLIETLAEIVKAARKANDDGLDIRTFQAVLKDKAKGG